MLRRFLDYVAEGIDRIERSLGGTPGTPIRIDPDRSSGHYDLRELLDEINNDAVLYLPKNQEPSYGKAYRQLAELDRVGRDAAAETLARPLDIFWNFVGDDWYYQRYKVTSFVAEVKHALTGETDLQVLLEACKKIAEDMQTNPDSPTRGLSDYMQLIGKSSVDRTN